MRGSAVALSACRACPRTGDLGATGDSRRLGRMPMRRNPCRFVLPASECPADSGVPRHRPSVVRRATGRLEHSRVMRDSARSTSSDRQSRSRRGHRRRHAAWTSQSTCRGPAGRGSARAVSGRCRARGRRAAGRGQPYAWILRQIVARDMTSGPPQVHSPLPGTGREPGPGCLACRRRAPVLWKITQPARPIFLERPARAVSWSARGAPRTL